MCPPMTRHRVCDSPVRNSSNNDKINNKNMKPDQQANDDSAEALARAAANYQMVIGEWCRCEDKPGIAYYRSPHGGEHGWMCCRCLRIVQTG
jgi:hypothetical protein